MITLVKGKLPKIVELCQRYRIAKLWLFGSALDPLQFTPKSDIDFLYQFDDGGTFNPHFQYVGNWSDMLDELRILLGREVQLIEYGPFKNPYFQESVESTMKLIYDKNAEKLFV